MKRRRRQKDDLSKHIVPEGSMLPSRPVLRAREIVFAAIGLILLLALLIGILNAFRLP